MPYLRRYSGGTMHPRRGSPHRRGAKRSLPHILAPGPTHWTLYWRQCVSCLTFEDVVDIFGQRGWYPGNGHSNAALSVMYAGMPPIVRWDLGQSTKPSGGAPNWHSLTLMLAEQPVTKQEAFRDCVCADSVHGRSRSLLCSTLTVIYASCNIGRPPLKAGV